MTAPDLARAIGAIGQRHWRSRPRPASLPASAGSVSERAGIGRSTMLARALVYGYVVLCVLSLILERPIPLAIGP
jgi:hypothetical protein